MIAGHFGLAAAVKSRAPETPLWALMVSTVWLDLLFIPTFVTRLETMEPVEQGHTGYGASFIHADYTHSFVGMLALSALLGVLAAGLWGRRSGIVVGLVAASHWLLDLLVHRADMPLLPGNAGGLPMIGLGLWHYPAASAAIELALVLLGAWLYWRAARQVVRVQGRGVRAAATAAVLIAVFGVLILWMDFTAK